MWSARCLPAKKDEEYYGHDYLDASRGFRNGRSICWSQMREMTTEDYYELDLGKKRVIRSIKFVDNGDGYPKKYKLLLDYNGDGRKFEEYGIYNGPIQISFTKPMKIVALRIEIVETKPEPLGNRGLPAWSIFDIEIIEVRFGLFNKFYEKLIKE